MAEQVQLLTWGDNRKDGPWIKLRLPHHDLLQVLRDLDPATGVAPRHVLDMVLALPDPDPRPASAGDPPAADIPPPAGGQTYGDHARALKLSGFTRTPDVWRALGTDADFLSWLRKQDCAARGQGECGGDVVAAHVRRIADGAGMGLKPEYSAIPLCDVHHRHQHQHGESALGGKDWFDRQRMHYVSEWAWTRLRAALGVESLRDASPEVVRQWAEAKGVERYLPVGYREVAWTQSPSTG